MRNGFHLMRGPLIALCSIALSLSWLVFFGAGVRQSDWDAALLFVGATALFYWSFRTGQTPPRVPLWYSVALWALPAYVLFQLIPLPQGLLAVLSPARSAVTENLSGVIAQLKHAPVSVAPAAAVLGLFSLLAFLTVMSLMRDLQWRFAVSRPWLPAIPLLLISAFEALIGVIQWLGAPQTLPVRGTFSSAEPFAGLLEVALPFTLVSGFISFRRHQELQVGSTLPAARAVATWLASLLILLALFHSSSKTSTAVVSCSLFILLALALIPRLKTRELRMYGMGSAAVVGIIALLLAISPVDAPASLAQLGAGEGDAAETRLNLWNSSASLLGEYRLLGTGLGGFESTFPKYQSSTDLNIVQHPHNDVLAMLITFGIGGSCIVLAVLVGILRPAIMGSLFLVDESRRLLAVAITASLLGVMVRSGMESAISMPAVALAVAWVAGMSHGIGLD